MANTKAPHHQGTYARRAAAVRQAAYANPTTRCRRCGHTYAEYRQLHGPIAARWTAGHINDGEINGQLVPEHARCNYSAGAVAGNRKRNPTSEQW